MNLRLLILGLAIAGRLGADEPKKMIIVGDSLTEGYGVAQEQAYPARLQVLLDQNKKPWHVVNSGISGSTAASAPTRVAWAIKQKPQLLVLALGANDGLRGTPTKSLEDNLSRALKACAEANVKAILVGMQIPPNYGAKYTKDFAAVFPHLAQKYKIPLIPFLLKDVAGKPELNQSDGIHPNAKGHQILAQTVYAALESQL